MKKLLLIFSCALFSNINAQNFINGKIYDYLVGDTIVEEYMPFNSQFSVGPPKTTMRVVTTKAFSPNLDSIFYTEFRAINTFTHNGSSWVATNSNTVLNYTVTNLQSSVINYTPVMGPCQFMHDTSFVNNCGLNVHVRSLKYDPNWGGGFCEPNVYVNTAIEGIGIYTHTVCGNCNPKGIGYEDKLLYAKKIGKPACGTKVNIITGLTESEKFTRINIFPNPSESAFYFNAFDYGRAEVYSATGQLIQKIDFVPGSNKIQMEGMPDGVYFISTFINGRRDHQKVIKH